MGTRTRKFIGVIIFLIVLVVYVVLMTELSNIVLAYDTHPGISLVFYTIAGLLWVFPAGAVIYWMSKETNSPSS